MNSGIHYLDAAAPEGMRLYAIGDVHGRLDLLGRMHEAIDAEISSDRPADWRVIHVGDYVDRGPDSRGVIDFLIDRRESNPRNIMLGGNHDFGLIEFLAEPSPLSLFARNGGRETAMSYGVNGDPAEQAGASEMARALRDRIPQRHLDFLGELPLSVSFGDYFFCHAGIRPSVPLEEQQRDDLIWIRNVFLDYPGLHPKVIVHGHTPRPEPEVMANRVDVDTGAFKSGILTAFVAEGGDKRFLSIHA